MNTLEPAEKQFFHVEWESTLKCNLDCSYCGDGHDNSQPHPPLAECKKTLDFIFDYVDLYMQTYPEDSNNVMKHCNINVYGGESMFHPDIVEILKYARHKRIDYDFSINISTITNAVVGPNTWKKIVPLLDHLTISYHAESVQKQKELIKRNIKHLKDEGKNFQVSCMMHPSHWNECVDMVEWCKSNAVKVIPRQIDSSWTETRFNYTKEQKEWLYGGCGSCVKDSVLDKISYVFKKGIDLSSKVRECCGKIPFFVDEDYSQVQSVVPNNFKGWNCSVNRFFLYIRQTTGQIYTNKDCKHNLESKVAPLGKLENAEQILHDLRKMIKTNTIPTITCKKTNCWCGMCTPKSADKDAFNRIIRKYSNDY